MKVGYTFVHMVPTGGVEIKQVMCLTDIVPKQKSVHTFIVNANLRVVCSSDACAGGSMTAWCEAAALNRPTTTGFAVCASTHCVGMVVLLQYGTRKIMPPWAIEPKQASSTWALLTNTLTIHATKCKKPYHILQGLNDCSAEEPLSVRCGT